MRDQSNNALLPENKTTVITCVAKQWVHNNDIEGGKYIGTNNHRTVDNDICSKQ